MEHDGEDPAGAGLALFSWGANSYGQLSLGAASEQEEAPRRVDGADLPLDPGCRLFGGGGHSAVLSGDGRALFACGWNARGQLGLGHRRGQSSFQRVERLPPGGVAAVGCGWDFTLVVAADGGVFGCGSNSYGQLGLGEECSGSEELVRVPGLEDVVGVACGLRHALFLDRSGRVFGCGSNRRGQLGGAERKNHTEVVRVPGTEMPSIRSVHAGQHFSALLASDGAIFCFGDGKFSQLLEGRSQELPGSAIRKIDADVFASPVASISCGWTHVVARLTNGDVVGWGRGDYGQLGRDGAQEDVGKVILEGCDVLISGSEHVLALCGQGRLLSWGWNEHGNCGTGGTANVPKPSPVGLPQEVEKILTVCAASGHNLVLVQTKVMP